MSDDFMGGEKLPYHKFENPGDTAVGIVDEVEKYQGRDFDTDEPKFWPDGKPVWEYRFELRDPDTGEVANLFVRGTLVKPIRQAVIDAGHQSVKGLLLKVRFDEWGEPKKKGAKPPKLWRVKVEPAPANAAPRKVAVAAADPDDVF